MAQSPLPSLFRLFGGLNRPRPLFICNCGRGVTKVYFNYGSLKCRRCANAIYASQTCSKRLRPILQAQRTHIFLKLKTGIPHPLAVVAADLKAVGAPTPIMFDAAVMAPLVPANVAIE